MEGTVTQARQEREKQGPWEVEVSFRGEADLHRHEAGCEKNRGHLKFVPVDQFTANNLPAGCRDNDLVNLVRAISDLTVRLSVKYVSEGRPEKHAESRLPYPCYKDRGGEMMRLGTGQVMVVSKHNSGDTCQCNECVQSLTPKTQFAEIHVRTATHVVYDSPEATHTTCHLFFDRGATPADCDGVISLSGISVVRSSVVRDVCEMICVSHDLALAERLENMVKYRDDLDKGVYYKYFPLEHERKNLSSPNKVSDALDNLVIIVSHPHGCSKQISVGKYIHTDHRDLSLQYTTATCPGSSGAPVIMLMDGGYSYWVKNFLHCGGIDKNDNMNFSNLYGV